VLVEQCRFEENGWNGISLQNQGTRATVRQCQLIANIHHGIEVWDHAAAVLENNRCAENCLNGILIDTSAVVRSKGNQLMANRDYGMFLRQAGGGACESNRIAENLLGGMVVTKAASAMSCSRNVFGSHQGPALSLGVGVAAAPYLENEFAEAVEKSIRRDLPVE
jgi:nitrous oxidase accessory protein NosD